MPRYILKIDIDDVPHYCEWSTIVDAPVTYLIPREEFIKRYLVTYPGETRDELDQRLARADSTGSSAYEDSAESLIIANRAGDNESEITLEEIAEKYVFRG